MTDGEMETLLSRYTPNGPPDGLGGRVVGEAMRRCRARRRWLIAAAVAGFLVVASLLLQGHAAWTYQHAVRLASGDSRPIPPAVMKAYAGRIGFASTGVAPSSDTPGGRNE